MVHTEAPDSRTPSPLVQLPHTHYFIFSISPNSLTKAFGGPSKRIRLLCRWLVRSNAVAAPVRQWVSPKILVPHRAAGDPGAHVRTAAGSWRARLQGERSHWSTHIVVRGVKQHGITIRAVGILASGGLVHGES